MRRIFAGCLFAVLLPIAALAQQRVIVVDNHVAQDGDGSFQHPFKTIAAASQASNEGDVIYVAPSPDAYAESVTLKPGQKLAGSTKDEAIASLGIDVPSIGDGPTIHGTVSVSSNNVIAAMTIVADRGNGVSAMRSTDKVIIRNVHFKTSNGMFGIALADHAGDVTLSDGTLDATENGGGISVSGGVGNLFIDNFPISGTFSTAVLVTDHNSGFILFRDGSPVRIDDSSQDAVVIQNMSSHGQVAFNAGLTIRSTKRRGLVVSHVQRMTVAGNASITTSNAAALEVTDSRADMTFDSISAEGSGFAHGIRVGHFNGHLVINGGTMRLASTPALDLEDVDRIEVNGMLIDGGAGIVATRVHDSTFSKIDVRRATGVVLNDVYGNVRFDHCAFAAPFLLDERLGEAHVTLDRCLVSAAVKVLASATTNVQFDVDTTDFSDTSLTATADNSARLVFGVHGGRFTGSPIDVIAAATSSVCADVSGVHAAPAEKAIRFSAVEGAHLNLVARGAGAAAARASVADANGGANVTIDAPASSIAISSKCE